MASLSAHDVSIRPAARADLPAIVAMLADDPLGAARERFEDPPPDSYYRAFDAISLSGNDELVVAEVDGESVGVMQLTIIPYLTYQGRSRALIEGVRVHRSVRGLGLGRHMFEWAIDRARDAGCHLVQLSTDRKRPDALAFYQSLGFVASHDGMKLHLE